MQIGSNMTDARAELLLGTLYDTLLMELRRRTGYPYINVASYAQEIRDGHRKPLVDRGELLDLVALCQWCINQVGERFAHIECKALQDAATLLDRELKEDL